MSRDRAIWNIRDTSLLLDLILDAKHRCHWSNRCPTTPGWSYIYEKFHERSNSRYTRKQMSNKWNDLKKAYFNWRNALLNKSGLGRDPETGDVTADPVLGAAITKEDSYDKAGKRFKCPPCCEILFNILGHETYDRGGLVDAEGHASENTATKTTPQTPTDVDIDPTPSQHPGQCSKRPVRDFSVESPVKKKTSKPLSYDDCISEFHSTCRAIQDRVKLGSSQERSPRTKQSDADTETQSVRDLLHQDGYSESDPFFHQALYLCTDLEQRREFLCMTSPEGRLQYVQMVWQAMQMWRPK